MPSPVRTPTSRSAQPQDSSEGAAARSISRPAPRPSAVVFRRVRALPVPLRVAGTLVSCGLTPAFGAAAARVEPTGFRLAGASREAPDWPEMIRRETATMSTTLTPATPGHSDPGSLCGRSPCQASRTSGTIIGLRRVIAHDAPDRPAHHPAESVGVLRTLAYGDLDRLDQRGTQLVDHRLGAGLVKEATANDLRGANQLSGTAVDGDNGDNDTFFREHAPVAQHADADVSDDPVDEDVCRGRLAGKVDPLVAELHDIAVLTDEHLVGQRPSRSRDESGVPACGTRRARARSSRHAIESRVASSPWWA